MKGREKKLENDKFERFRQQNAIARLREQIASGIDMGEISKVWNRETICDIAFVDL